MTAELALICLETEAITMYSSSPDRTFSISVKFILTNEMGKPYPTPGTLPAQSSGSQGMGAIAYAARRQRDAERRRREELRTFVLYSSIPSTMVNADDEELARVRGAAATQIRAHFLGASVRMNAAKTKGGRNKADDQFFVTPTADTPPDKFIHLGPLAATDADSAPTGQPPLSALRCLDVGAPGREPAFVRPSPQLRNTLSIKGCCMRRSCVPGNRGRDCNILDLYYDARRRPREESEGKREYRQAQAEKERKRARRQGLLQSEEAHVAAQHTSRFGGADRCQAWEYGRCRRFGGEHAAQRHGTADETMITVCCSRRGPLDDGYSPLFQTCPFMFSDQPCPYMGHEDDQPGDVRPLQQN